jgi:hypothetical protein
MRSTLPRKIAGLIAAALIVGVSALPAKADDFGKRFTIDIAPFLDLGTNGDANAPAPPGYGALGYTNDHPIPQDLKLDYGLDFRIDNATHLSYSRSNLDLAIGRVLLPGKTALVSGDIVDRTDTAALSHSFGRTGLSAQLYYFSHVRQDVTGLCLNQSYCTAAQLGGVGGGATGNPAAIDEHGYGLHLGYNFGPQTPIGPPFTVGVDAKYIPRPGTQPPPGNPGNLGGLGHYVGSQWLFPYSISGRIPFLPDHTIIPFIGYERASVLFRDEATPEVYNATNFGIVKIINRSLALSLVNLNFQECRCADTVPPPDNVRFTVLLLKLDYKLGL